MKTNTSQVVITGVFIGVIAIVATSRTAINVSILAAGISYIAVAIIAAVAAVDYRKSTNNYAVR